MDVVAGTLEVDRKDDTHEVIIHYRDLYPGHECGSEIVFSPSQARHFAYLLLKNAADAERESSGTIRKRGKSRMK
jgi:hypothetical protein